MKIVWDKPAVELFRELSTGDVFSYNETLYMKMPEVDDDGGESFNAINLENGSIIYFYQQDKVTIHNCEIIVK